MNEELVDRALVQSYLEIGQGDAAAHAVLEETADLLAAQVESSLERMPQLIAQQDRAGLDRELHLLSGSAANAGASRLHAFCGQIRPEGPAPEDFACLRSLAAESLDALRREIRG